MKKIIRNTFVAIIRIFCWLTVSPLFYYLAGRWKLTKWRLPLMLISPLFLVTYFIIMIWGYFTYVDLQRKYYFTDEDRIERITGVRFPDMNIVEYNKGRTSFTGDYTDVLLVEFEEIPSEKVYQTLDSLIYMDKASWRKKGDSYEFSMMWGNGMPAPKGESDDEDRMFCISFGKGSRRAIIQSGMW